MYHIPLLHHQYIYAFQIGSKYWQALSVLITHTISRGLSFPPPFSLLHYTNVFYRSSIVVLVYPICEKATFSPPLSMLQIKAGGALTSLLCGSELLGLNWSKHKRFWSSGRTLEVADSHPACNGKSSITWSIGQVSIKAGKERSQYCHTTYAHGAHGAVCEVCLFKYVSGSIDLAYCKTLYADLKKGLEGLILESCLHLLFLTTPYDMISQCNPDWMIYFKQVRAFRKHALRGPGQPKTDIFIASLEEVFPVASLLPATGNSHLYRLSGMYATSSCALARQKEKRLQQMGKRCPLILAKP